MCLYSIIYCHELADAIPALLATVWLVFTAEAGNNWLIECKPVVVLNDGELYWFTVGIFWESKDIIIKLLSSSALPFPSTEAVRVLLANEIAVINGNPVGTVLIDETWPFSTGPFYLLTTSDQK